MKQEEDDRFLTPGEVAVMFQVDPKTVTRWARSGRLIAYRTLGGHRRYRESEVRVLLLPEKEVKLRRAAVHEIAAEALNLAEALAHTVKSENALLQVKDLRNELRKAVHL